MDDEMNRAARPNAERHALSRRRLLTGAATAATATILDACSGKSGTRSTTRASSGTATADSAMRDATTTRTTGSKELRMARNAEPLSPFIPWQIEDNATLFISVNVYDTLLRTTKDGLGVEPGLATNWEPSPDSLMWTFTLRDGLKFADGTPVSGGDVKTSLDQCITGGKSVWKNDYKAIKEIQATDDKTIKVILNQPHTPILSKLAMFCAAILPAPMAIASDNDGFDATRSMGTGAYTLNGWERGTPLVLTRNPHYWKDTPNIESVIVEHVPDDTARIMKLQGSETDLIDFVPPNQMQSLGQQPNIKTQAFATQQMAMLIMNSTVKPLDDVRIRRALNYALDKEIILKSVYGGNAKTMTAPIPPGTYWDKALVGYPFDLTTAMQLMAASSQPNGFTLEYTIASGDTVHQQIATLARDQWAKIGIAVTIQQQERSAVRQAYRDGTVAMTPGGWTNDMNDPTEVVNYEMRGGGSPFAHWTRYNNPDVNARIAVANLEQDPKKRAAEYAEIQKIYLDDAPLVFIAYPSATAAWQKYVEGFFIDGLAYYRFEDVKMNK